MDIKELTWDSENFGFKVGEYIISEQNDFDYYEIQNIGIKNEFKLIYLKSPIKLVFPTNINLFYDERIGYSKARIIRDKINDKNIKSYKNKEIPSDLYNLSIASGKYSRYNIDPRFPNALFEKLYRAWLYNSVKTNFATDVLVYENKEKAIGFIAYKNDGSETSIPVISAINSSMRGMGIGSKLWQYYESNLNDNINTLKVVTQGINTSACHFYEKNGYNIFSKTYIYHLWL